MDLPCRECIVVSVCSELCPPIEDMKEKIIERIGLNLYSCSFCGGRTLITHYIISPLIQTSCTTCHAILRYNLPQLLQKWKWV